MITAQNKDLRFVWAYPSRQMYDFLSLQNSVTHSLPTISDEYLHFSLRLIVCMSHAQASVPNRVSFNLTQFHFGLPASA